MRREEFMKRKAETASNKEPFDSDKVMENSQDFKCDQCDINFKIDQGLKIHVGKAHTSENLRENTENNYLELSLPA